MGEGGGERYFEFRRDSLLEEEVQLWCEQSSNFSTSATHPRHPKITPTPSYCFNIAPAAGIITTTTSKADVREHAYHYDDCGLRFNQLLLPCHHQIVADDVYQTGSGAILR